MAQKETRAQKFARIAERRVNETIRMLRLLRNLADRGNYDYSESQATLLLNAIDQETRALRMKFKSELGASGRRFSFNKDA